MQQVLWKVMTKPCCDWEPWTIFGFTVDLSRLTLMVMLYQDAVLLYNLPLKETFCSSCLRYTCLAWFFLKKTEMVDHDLILFILSLDMNVNSHLQSKIPLKFGILFWLYSLETNFNCCLLKNLGILEKVTAIKYNVSRFSRYT